MTANPPAVGRYGCRSMWGPIRRLLLKRPAEAYACHASNPEHWRELGYLHAPDLDAASREYDHFVAVLAAYVPEIAYLPVDARTGLDSLYVHDPVVMTERGAILCRMGKVARRGEPDAVAAVLSTLDIPVLGRIEPPGILESGDVVWLDACTMAVGQGYRTNAEGLRQLRVLVEDFVDELVPVPLPHDRGPEACLHLMSLVSIADRNLAVVYTPLLSASFRDLLLQRSMQLIEVEPDEYATLGGNVLALAPRVCVMLTGNPRTADALKDAGAVVHTVVGREIGLNGTGGPTCLTRPLWRRD